ncbi:MAG: hypothetical protein V4634_21305 [Pseudomonadota bacterium]
MPRFLFAWKRCPGYHLIHKRHPTLIPRLEAALHNMKAAGRITRMQDEAEKDFGAYSIPDSGGSAVPSRARN